MKRINKIVACILCICLLVGMTPLNVRADDVLEYGYVPFNVDGKETNIDCVKDDNLIYCKAEDVASLCGYTMAQIDGTTQFDFFRNIHVSEGLDFPETATLFTVSVDESGKMSMVQAMGDEYNIKCYILDEILYLPIGSLMCFLHADYTPLPEMIYVTPMGNTIMDFLTFNTIDIYSMESSLMDTAINTGKPFSNTRFGSSAYAVLCDFLKDFDSKVFLFWFNDDGNVKMTQNYEKAILQLGVSDSDFLSNQLKEDGLSQIMNSTFYINGRYIRYSKDLLALDEELKTVVTTPENAENLVRFFAKNSLKMEGKKGESLQKYIDKLDEGDGKEVMKKWFKNHPNTEFPGMNMPIVNTTEENLDVIKKNVNTGTFPYLRESVEKVGNALDLTQLVWNIYSDITCMKDWNEKDVEQLKILRDCNYPKYINKSLKKSVKQASDNLIQLYHKSGDVILKKTMQNLTGFTINAFFDKTKVGQYFGMFYTGASLSSDVMSLSDGFATNDFYSKLNIVIPTVKIEQIVFEMIKNEDILHSTKKLTLKDIQDYRAKLTLYLRLNMRNKAQLYELNKTGNVNDDWEKTEEAKNMYQDMVNGFVLIGQLADTIPYDDKLILDGFDIITGICNDLPLELFHSGGNAGVGENGNTKLDKIYQDLLEQTIIPSVGLADLTDFNFSGLNEMWHVEANPENMGVIAAKEYDFNNDGIQELLVLYLKDELYERPEGSDDFMLENLYMDLYTIQEGQAVCVGNEGPIEPVLPWSIYFTSLDDGYIGLKKSDGRSYLYFERRTGGEGPSDFSKYVYDMTDIWNIEKTEYHGICDTGRIDGEVVFPVDRECGTDCRHWAWLKVTEDTMDILYEEDMLMPEEGSMDYSPFIQKNSKQQALQAVQEELSARGITNGRKTEGMETVVQWVYDWSDYKVHMTEYTGITGEPVVYDRSSQEISNLDEQINLIVESQDEWLTVVAAADTTYEYSITDLDQNGKLEVLKCTTIDEENGYRKQYKKEIWEVQDDYSGLLKRSGREGGIPLSDIDQTDVYYDDLMNIYYYMWCYEAPGICGYIHTIKDSFSYAVDYSEEYLVDKETGINSIIPNEVYYTVGEERYVDKTLYDNVESIMYPGTDKKKASFFWMQGYEILQDPVEMLKKSYNGFAIS